MTKLCPRCQQVKSADGFYQRKLPRVGLSSWCKDCTKESRALFCKTKKDHVSAYNKAYRDENADEIKVQRAEYRRLNRELVSASAKTWRASNKELVSQYRKEWQQNNPDKVLAYVRGREAHIKRATPLWAEKFFIAEAYHIAKVREKTFGFKWHVDHIVPLRGKSVCGLHVHNNLQVIPAAKNLAKGSTFSLTL